MPHGPRLEPALPLATVRRRGADALQIFASWQTCQEGEPIRERDVGDDQPSTWPQHLRRPAIEARSIEIECALDRDQPIDRPIGEARQRLRFTETERQLVIELLTPSA